MPDDFEDNSNPGISQESQFSEKFLTSAKHSQAVAFPASTQAVISAVQASQGVMSPDSGNAKKTGSVCESPIELDLLLQ